MHDGEPPAVRGDAPRGLFTPRWVELFVRHMALNVLREGGVKFTSTDFLILMPPWDRVVVTHDLWPDELVDDVD